MARAMKDSGIEWIEDIPAHWKVTKIKNIVKIVNGKDNVVKDGDVPVYGSSATPFGFTDKIMYDKETVLMGRKGTIDKPQYVTKPFWAVDTVFYTIPRGNTSLKFFFYCMNVFDYKKYTYGSAIPSMSQGILNEIKLPNPILIEQQKIADFLDDKTAHIDSITIKTKKSIEALKAYKQSIITQAVTKGLNPDSKMKYSGIEWIGEIPEHCSIKKVRIVASKIGSGKTPRGGASVYSDEGILFLRSQNVYNTGLYLDEATYISEEIDEAMRSTRVFPNDVLLNITGASIGRCCVYPENLNRLANVNQHVCIIRPIKNKIIPRFLTYFFNSSAGQSAIRYYQTGGNREGLNFEQIGNIRIPYYSIEEQQLIAAFLDEKTAHIDSLIANKEKMVQELESYKKAMIYEYVTGKKEVE